MSNLPCKQSAYEAAKAGLRLAFLQLLQFTNSGTTGNTRGNLKPVRAMALAPRFERCERLQRVLASSASLSQRRRVEEMRPAAIQLSNYENTCCTRRIMSCLRKEKSDFPPVRLRRRAEDDRRSRAVPTNRYTNTSKLLRLGAFYKFNQVLAAADEIRRQHVSLQPLPPPTCSRLR